MFIIVPKPGICLSGTQSIITKMLIIKVAKPMLQPVIFFTPCANTVQGLTPIPDEIKSASPRPNKKRPKIKIKTDIKGGRTVEADGELQNSFGTDLTFKNLSFIFIFLNIS
ncbi:MAG: hypothetical protein P8H90_06235 [Tateyamaria sp.]|nr:hypothetical protein [Tateyamaria sp.]MDG2379652.1 hypothetical protein [Tateyamaria sp.]